MAYTTEENENYQPPVYEMAGTSNEKLEKLLDLIADALIQSTLVSSSIVKESQKFIRNGQIQVGQGAGILALFQKDINANQEDLNNVATIGEYEGNLQFVADRITDFDTLEINIQAGPVPEDGEAAYPISITLDGGGLNFGDAAIDITSLIYAIDNNPYNVSQFIELQQSSSIVDVEAANEFLDTNIYELLPTSDTRQARIIRFFGELNALLPNTIPNFSNPVERDENGNWIGDEEYSQNNSISYAQDNPNDTNINEEEAFIHRLKAGSGAISPNDTNSSRTIEDIYNTILPYLTDILEEPIITDDERPTYKNQSSGYLQFRNPNQGIIIRNTNKEFIDGLDPNNPTFLETGFTITMWVRFLDKVSEGTLFNFGNPLREENPFGFKLETYVLNKDDPTPHSGHEDWGYTDIYSQERIDNPGTNDIYIPRYENSNTARYVRLVVQDGEVLRDSHTGVGGGPKRNTIGTLLARDNAIANGESGGDDHAISLAQTTFIPQDFNEWYFICASFDANVEEDDSYESSDGGLQTNPTPIDLSHSTYYWLNHVNPADGNFESSSGFGNKCKVEIISRTDLLRARGFKV